MHRRRIISAILVSAGLLLSACAPSSPGSPRGDLAPSGQAVGKDGSRVNPTRDRTAVRTLDADELALVYLLLHQEYVDQIDGATVVNGATKALNELMLRGGFLPLDLSLINLASIQQGDPPGQVWSAFSSGYEALVEKHAAWSRTARPDQAAIRGMLAALNDSHTTYFSAEERQRQQETTYGGIGVRLSKLEEGRSPIIVEVFPRSPAAQAGLKAGDRLESADGRATTDLPITEIVQFIRGAPDSVVRIGYTRQGQPGTVSVTRAVVEPRRVEGGALGSGVGYLRIRGFGTDVPNAVIDQLGGLERARAQGVRGLILDLRGNAGGDLRAVQNVGGAFFPGKPIGLSVDRSGTQTPLPAEGRKRISEDPMVVLIDRDTGSGAEILATALREHGVATILGTSSAGSVGIASVHTLPDGSAVQITEKRLVAPSGERLDRVGVKPDIEVPTTVADLEAGRDPQLDRAIQVIRQRLGS